MSNEAGTENPSADQTDAPLQSIQIFPKREHYGADKKPLCAYGGCVCTQRPMRGYSFCVKHILQDSTAPFKQCDFISRQSGKRCGNPVPKTQEDNKYCNAHRQMLGLAPRGSAGYSRRKKKANAEAKEDKKEGTTKKKESSKKRLQSTTAADDTETEDESTATTSKKKKKKTTATSTQNTGSLMLPIPEDGIVVKTEDEESHAVYYDNSETDSDVPTDVEEDEDRSNISLAKAFQNEEVVTEEEYLKLRKERIEKLLSIYQAKYYHLKYELKAQYDEFIKQRNIAVNELLRADQKKPSSDEQPENPSESSTNETGSVEVKLHVTNPESASHARYKQLLASFVHYPHRASGEPLQCTKVLKHDPEGIPLCSYANCTASRLFLSEFCFKHILYDSNQVLYTADKTGEPVMIYSQVQPVVEEAAPVAAPKKSKKIAIVEDKRKKKSASASKQNSEAVKGQTETALTQSKQEAAEKIPALAASPPKVNPPEQLPRDDEEEEEEELLIKEEGAEEMEEDEFGDDEDEGMPNAD